MLIKLLKKHLTILSLLSLIFVKLGKAAVSGILWNLLAQLLKVNPMNFIAEDKLGAFITVVGKKAKALDEDIQQAGLSSMAVFEKTGNVFYINKLYTSLGKGARHSAMTAWMLGYGGVKANTSEAKDTTPFVKDASKQVDIDGAQETPWYDMKPSPAPDAVFDVLALALSMLKKQPKDGQESANMALRDRLAGVVAQYKAEVDAAASPEAAQEAADAILSEV
jgi:hypothetical protein